MLVGRDEEMARLEGLVTDLARGQGSVLLVQGQAGVGKTALLTTLRELATSHGIRLLHTTGVETEAELVFAGLYDLLAPVLPDADALSSPLAGALRGALALTAPQPGDRLGICVAVHQLLELVASQQPTLVVVDDLMWIDAASLGCLLYAARRTSGSFAVAVAVRDDAIPPGTAWLPTLAVMPLTDDAARRWFSDNAPDLAEPVRDELMAVAAGNPLAMRELLDSLDPDQRRGVTSLPAPLQPGPRLRAAYRDRARRLPPASASLLLAAAAHAGDDVRVLSAVGAHLDATLEDLAPAEAAGLVIIGDGRVNFTHPLVRATVYHDAAPERRREVHRALASVVSGEARAWHLAAAAVGPDEGIAAVMEEAALAAMARGGPAPASDAFERAARLTPEHARFAGRLLAAGEAAARAALPERALALFDEVATAGTDDVTRATALHGRALTLYQQGAVGSALETLAAATTNVGVLERTRGAAMLADAAMASAAAAECHRSLEFAQEAAALLDDDDPPAVRAQVLAALGWALVMRGHASQARPTLDEVERLAATFDPLSDAGQSVAHSLNFRVWSGAFEVVRDECLAIAERARRLGAVSALPLRLALLADCSYRLGAWDDAEGAIRDTLVASEDANQPMWSGAATVVGARLAAARGQAAQVRAVAPGVLNVSESSGARSGIPMIRAVLGFLELGFGRTSAALEELEAVARFTDESGMEEPTVIPWEADLIEAYLREGRPDEASRALEVMGRRAEQVGSPMALAAYERCRGMLGEDYDTRFAAALAHDDLRPMPFERARTLLAYGRRLHRAKRRGEARRVLHEALDIFEALGAAPWLEQARSELLSAGGRRRRAASTDGELTPPERRVAEAVARGLTNRDVAAELFISPKTVEFHLGNVYRKLGIGSRTQLVAALKRGAGDTTEPSAASHA